MLISIHNIRYMKPWEILRQLPVAIGFWRFDLNPLKPYGTPQSWLGFERPQPNPTAWPGSQSYGTPKGQNPTATGSCHIGFCLFLPSKSLKKIRRPKGRILRQQAVAIGFCLFCLKSFKKKCRPKPGPTVSPKPNPTARPNPNPTARPNPPILRHAQTPQSYGAPKPPNPTARPNPNPTVRPYPNPTTTSETGKSQSYYLTDTNPTARTSSQVLILRSTQPTTEKVKEGKFQTIPEPASWKKRWGHVKHQSGGVCVQHLKVYFPYITHDCERSHMNKLEQLAANRHRSENTWSTPLHSFELVACVMMTGITEPDKPRQTCQKQWFLQVPGSQSHTARFRNNIENQEVHNTCCFSTSQISGLRSGHPTSKRTFSASIWKHQFQPL